MAESESGADKSEEPTEKRLRESREEGQIARSRELSTLVVVMSGVIAVMIYGGDLASALVDLMRGCLSINRDTLMDTGSMALLLLKAGSMAIKALAPILAVLLAASIVGNIALGGWMFSTKTMVPRFSRLNPGPGLARMFSKKSVIELVKALAKFSITLMVGLVVLSNDRDDLLALSGQPLEAALGHAVKVLGNSALWMASGLILIAAVDVPFQLWDNKQKLMMTKQEVKDEYKDSEGKPEVKGKIRQMQRQMAERRMMQAVPEADVVITNPTHFAVALKYDPTKGTAPVVLAKGGDFLALKIREIAQEHKVLLMESPALARSVYYSTEVDQEIPAGLYLAVAQVLAYVYQLKQFRSGKGKRPTPLPDLPIPPDLRRDE
ncbi:flagellar biosynthesis protein FlhB [Pseudomonas kuykendallii]|uniref:flagellar biosynthesis protein FlhB n=1 Tax=Pseudomonas kuykendallii TaxID=1007099 RepID=UPI0028D39746|nr:flagellar biosynthesis protein FlhB [Pseudomonas kuykendallii]